jgi:hypothetical protein
VFLFLAIDGSAQDHNFSLGVGKISILSPALFEATYLNGYTFEASYLLQTSSFNQIGLIGTFSNHQSNSLNPLSQSMNTSSFGLLHKLFLPDQLTPSIVRGTSFSPYVLSEISAVHRDQKYVVILNQGPNLSELRIESTNTKFAYSVGMDISFEDELNLFVDYGRAIYYFQEANRTHNKLMFGFRFTLADIAR